ncbi:hypothetical protein AX16_003798 [Volvariella volvacea WC 439]|nr:hypothetical protein AX16_003798 [Volvariella volvacea WC 439]
MPRNHKLVPDALRSELDEYASLIRVLRTNDALDITSQLTRHSSRNLSHDAPQLQPQDDEGAQDVEEDQPSDSEHKGPKTRSKAAAGKPSTTPPKPSRKRKRPEARPKSSRPATKRDLWTRWPLLAGDVWPPQWGLQDEINSLVTHILKNRPLPPFPDSIPTEPFADADEESGMDIDTPPSSQLPQESQQDDSDSDIDVDMHPFVPYLTATSTHLLSTILSLLASHTPNRAASLQNRIEPMGWRSVLDVLSVYPDQNFVDEKFVHSFTHI